MRLSKMLFMSLSTLLIGTSFTIVRAREKSIKNFTLEDYSDKKHLLADYQDSKAIVVMFIATQCPVSTAYNKRMASNLKLRLKSSENRQ